MYYVPAVPPEIVRAPHFIAHPPSPAHADLTPSEVELREKKPSEKELKEKKSPEEELREKILNQIEYYFRLIFCDAFQKLSFGLAWIIRAVVCSEFYIYSL